MSEKIKHQPTAQPTPRASTPTADYERPLWKPPLPTPATNKRLETVVIELNRRIEDILCKHKNPVFSTSLVVEDMVLLDAIFRSGQRIRAFTLNTGKLPVQTLALLTRAQNTYESLIEEIHPQQEDLVRFFNTHSDFSSIYQSQEARLACCDIRIVKPMARILKSADAWITGRRRGQSITRADLRYSEKSHEFQLTKYNPIYDWDEELIWAYALHNNVPIHELHHCGFPSIGCETCTRAVYQGEDIRAGRWWWEKPENKESGMHSKK